MALNMYKYEYAKQRNSSKSKKMSAVNTESTYNDMKSPHQVFYAFSSDRLGILLIRAKIQYFNTYIDIYILVKLCFMFHITININ